MRPEGYIAEVPGMLIARWLCPLRGELLADIRAAHRAAHANSPRGLVSVASFGLDKRFPLAPGFDTNLSELAQTFAFTRPMLLATAVVLEFDGFLAAAMRRTSATIQRLVRGAPPVRLFKRHIEAIDWVMPRIPAEVVAAPLGGYVRAAARMAAEFAAWQTDEAARPRVRAETG
jgi:hypothetical protein